MTIDDLKPSGVVFNEEDHTYWLGDKQLYGITGMIQRQLFPDKYKGVSKEVLQKRADFGHDFHKDMELYIMTGLESGTDMFRVFKENYMDINFIASEYIVTDGNMFASPIDAVDEDFVLYDFKTSTKKDEEYWRWQLSVYRYLFYLQNGFHPSGLKVLWINKDLKHELVEIKPIEDEVIMELLNAEDEGKQFVNPLKQEIYIPQHDLSLIANIEEELIKAEEHLKQLKESEANMKKDILGVMREKGIKSWETDRLKFTIKDEYERSTVDSKALKESYPDIYNECLKTSKVSASLTIKIK